MDDMNSMKEALSARKGKTFSLELSVDDKGDISVNGQPLAPAAEKEIEIEMEAPAQDLAPGKPEAPMEDEVKKFGDEQLGEMPEWDKEALKNRKPRTITERAAKMHMEKGK